MSKKRTKKQKLKSRSRLLNELKNTSENIIPEPDVNRKIKYNVKSQTKKRAVSKNAVKTVINYETTKIKRDIVKSLALSCFIIALELVLYLAWKN